MPDLSYSISRIKEPYWAFTSFRVNLTSNDTPKETIFFQIVQFQFKANELKKYKNKN